jgi:hypothetical protein
MVRFIKQEAEEKANEIKVSAEEVRVVGCGLLQAMSDAVMLAGVQPREAAVARAGKGKDSQGLRAQGGASGGQEENVRNPSALRVSCLC